MKIRKPQKLDLYKECKADYATPRKPVLLMLKAAQYLAVSGKGEPGGPEFTDKIGALYGCAFTVKMTRKFAGQQDYTVCKLEGQWWSENGESNFAKFPKKDWCWKLLIRTPDFVGKDELAKAVAALLKKGKSPSVREVKLETLDEGECVQMLHVGPYEKEGETIEQMRAAAAAKGLGFHGQHHEIYLSDPRRVPAERLRTILRQPVRAL